ncbi:conserved Plasmodium protein, unknown function [Plasmodium vivax]|uniref:Uncharacterized protein n=1 Tax=Plasmodium vivax TaxID=5855 RepID=A0A1G4GS45_PLAVI|nr:conserved Plasmodium protein, unknown function [Plasmodium vivax]
MVLGKMATGRSATEVVNQIAGRYLPSVNIAHLVCSTLLLNYLVAHLVVTTVWLSPRGEENHHVVGGANHHLVGEANHHLVGEANHHLVGEANLTSPSSREEGPPPHRRAYNQEDFTTHRVGVAYVLCCILCCIAKLATLCMQTRGSKGSQLESRTDEAAKHESVPHAMRRRRQMWVTSGHLLMYVLLAELGMHKGGIGTTGKTPPFFPFILAVCEVGTPLISLISIVGAVRRGYISGYLKERKKKKKKKKMNRVDLFLFVCYFAVERVCKRNFRREGGSAGGEQTVEICREPDERASTGKRTTKGVTHGGELKGRNAIRANVQKGWLFPRCVKLLVHMLQQRLSPFQLRDVGRVPPNGMASQEAARGRSATNQVGTNTVGRDRGISGRGSHVGGDGGSYTTLEKRHMKKGAGKNHSGSHPHEESSDSQGELCQRVRTNAHQYKKFYHQYCKDLRGDEEEAEGQSSSGGSHPFLKCPTLRERRKFKVIQGGGGQQRGEGVASPGETPLIGETPSSVTPSARDNERGEKGVNFGSAQTRSLDDKRSYTSLYFPSVTETGSSKGGSGGGSSGRSCCEGGGLSGGHLQSDLRRMEGKHLHRGAEQKAKMKKARKTKKKHHGVYLSPDGAKCSRSICAEEKANSRDAVSSNRVRSDSVNALEAHIRTFLSDFKKKREILTFLNDIHKTILMMRILSLLLTKGILMCTSLYFLHIVPVASGVPSTPPGVLPLLQVCHFALFHLYVREYAARRRCR